MSVYMIYMKDGAKMMRPILKREEYLAQRDGGNQKPYLKRIHSGEEKLKNKLLQINYSCLPNDDGSLKGSSRMSTTVGMDIDFVAPKELSAEEQQALVQEAEQRLRGEVDPEALNEADRAARRYAGAESGIRNEV